eukprot:1161129-Pelagomonas_calceolata.AAC.13
MKLSGRWGCVSVSVCTACGKNASFQNNDEKLGYETRLQQQGAEKAGGDAEALKRARLTVEAEEQRRREEEEEEREREKQHQKQGASKGVQPGRQQQEESSDEEAKERRGEKRKNYADQGWLHALRGLVPSWEDVCLMRVHACARRGAAAGPKWRNEVHKHAIASTRGAAAGPKWRNEVHKHAIASARGAAAGPKWRNEVHKHAIASARGAAAGPKWILHPRKPTSCIQQRHVLCALACTFAPTNTNSAVFDLRAPWCAAEAASSSHEKKEEANIH